MSDSQTRPGPASQPPGSRNPDPLLLLRRDFPAFRIWRETLPGGTRYLARRRDPGTHPHSAMTADPDELRAVLAGAQHGEHQ